MATICRSGCAPEKEKQGFKGLCELEGTAESVLATGELFELFFGCEVCLVRGWTLARNYPNEAEYYVMLKYPKSMN